ncbi:hypothetical protein EJF15_40859 [Clavispora lusitaniae]|nr:hypothetical protein EJF15_40859 [Clavispora lusitaniae]
MQNIGREVRREEEKTKDSANRRENTELSGESEQNTTSDGQYRRYNTRLRPVRRLRPESTGARRPRSRSSLRSGEQKDCSTTISRIVSNCITRCGSKWLD